jgi:hypothetical protein
VLDIAAMSIITLPNQSSLLDTVHKKRIKSGIICIYDAFVYQIDHGNGTDTTVILTASIGPTLTKIDHFSRRVFANFHEDLADES